MEKKQTADEFADELNKKYETIKPRLKAMEKETFEEFLEREGYPEGSFSQEIWEDGAKKGAEWQRQQQESKQVSQKFESMLTTPASTLSIKGETKN